MPTPCYTINIPFTTDASGDATVYSDPVAGIIKSLTVDTGDCTNGAVDVTITNEQTGETITALTNLATASTLDYWPQAPTTEPADGTAINNLARTQLAIGNARIKVVVADGGDTKSGSVYVTLA